MNKKVCILTSVHSAFDVRVFHREAKTLAKAGYDVVLIAQHNRNETVDGVKIFALPRPKNRLFRIFGTTLKVFKLALRQKADIYHFHNPELLLWGVVLRLYTKRPVIYDVHEDFPDAVRIRGWIPSAFRELAAQLLDISEKFLSRLVNCVIVADDNIKKRFSPGRNVVTLLNFPKLEYFKGEIMQHDPNLIIHVGSLVSERGGDVMVEAIEIAKQKLPQIKLLLIGNISDRKYKNHLQNKIKDSGLIPNISLSEALLHEDVIRYIGQAAIGLSLLQPVPKFKKNIPQKVFEYMACGIPAIVSNLPPILPFVKDINCVILVDSTNPKKIANAVEYLIEHPDEARKMGENGRKAVVVKYNWETESKKLIDVYEKLLK